MKRLIFSIAIASIFLYRLFPFFWTIRTALKPAEEVFRLPVSYFPETVSLENMIDVFSKRPFGRYVPNSLSQEGGRRSLPCGQRPFSPSG